MSDILFLIFRFLCFIIPSYLVLESIYDTNHKAFIYLLGLIITCTLSVVILKPMLKRKPTTYNLYCHLFSLTSSIPISTMILSFTFSYLMYCVSRLHVNSKNIISSTYNHITSDVNLIITIVFYLLFIFLDVFFNGYIGCTTSFNLFLIMIFSFIFGILWGITVNSLNIPNSLYYTLTSNNNKCPVSNNVKIRCAAFRDGIQLTYGVEENNIVGTSRISSARLLRSDDDDDNDAERLRNEKMAGPNVPFDKWKNQVPVESTKNKKCGQDGFKAI